MQNSEIKKNWIKCFQIKKNTQNPPEKGWEIVFYFYFHKLNTQILFLSRSTACKADVLFLTIQ